MTNEHQQQKQQQQLVVSLTDSSSISSSIKDDDVSTTTPARVGGKASSLAKLFAIDYGLGSSSVVPKAYALTVDFFQPWINEMKLSSNFKSLITSLQIIGISTDDDDDDDNNNNNNNNNKGDEELLCKKLQNSSYKLTLSKQQTDVIQMLVNEMNSSSWNTPNLAAVRSSAPEEDGVVSSFAGAFDTCLGVGSTFNELEKAIRICFASLWDYRVLHYKQMNTSTTSSGSGSNIDSNIASSNGSAASFTTNDNIIGGFAVVVMEMIDSQIAGVAFSANPLNSDRDELVIDSVSLVVYFLIF
jgi:phosphoenolpyruvate synthase/pyruvate phosphate dikinase